MKRIPVLLGAGMAIAAASSPAGATSVVYHCPLNVNVSADYSSDASKVTLHVAGQTFVLPQAMSGSGARYSDGKTTIWEHQGEATFETPGASFTGCKVGKPAP